MEPTKLDRLAALRYLAENGSHSSEWAEAGLCNELERVLFSEQTEFDTRELDQALELAERY